MIVVGLNHRTVPVELLERMTVPEHMVPKVLHDLMAREHLLEVVVLSTCNRTEIYARCTHFHGAVGDVRDFLADHSGAAPEEFENHLYTYYDDAAVGHLFSVVAGLDSIRILRPAMRSRDKSNRVTAIFKMIGCRLSPGNVGHGGRGGQGLYSIR